MRFSFVSRPISEAMKIANENCKSVLSVSCRALLLAPAGVLPIALAALFCRLGSFNVRWL